eukprot:242010_1
MIYRNTDQQEQRHHQMLSQCGRSAPDRVSNIAPNRSNIAPNREHTMVSHTKCNKQILDIDEYKKKARNKLNRWKPKVFGEHVLFEIIFINLYNVCNTRHTAQQQHSRKSTQTKHCITIGRCRRFEWDDVRINRSFVSVFVELLDAKIRFKKT